MVLSQKEIYSTFVRTRPYTTETREGLELIIKRLFNEFKWSHVGIAQSYSEDWYETGKFVVDSLSSIKLEPIILTEFHDLKEAVKLLKDQSRGKLSMFFSRGGVVKHSLSKE